MKLKSKALCYGKVLKDFTKGISVKSELCFACDKETDWGITSRFTYSKMYKGKTAGGANTKPCCRSVNTAINQTAINLTAIWFVPWCSNRPLLCSLALSAGSAGMPVLLPGGWGALGKANQHQPSPTSLWALGESTQHLLDLYRTLHTCVSSLICVPGRESFWLCCQCSPISALHLSSVSLCHSPCRATLLHQLPFTSCTVAKSLQKKYNFVSMHQRKRKAWFFLCIRICIHRQHLL